MESQDSLDPISLQNDRLIRAARGDKVDRPPVWIMRQAGRYLPEYHRVKGNLDFFECCRSPEIASTLTLQPVERYAGLIDAAVIYSDILVIPQAMGMRVEMVNNVPTFLDPLQTPDHPQYAVIMAHPLQIATSLHYVYDAIRLTRKKLAGRVPLIGFCGAPWTLFRYMLGSERNAKIWLYRYPSASHDLLSKISQACIKHLALQVAAGAQTLQVFDSSAGELSPSCFSTFALPYLRLISASLSPALAQLGISTTPPLIVFAKGAWYALDALCDSGYDVVGLNWTHDPADAVRIAQGRVSLQGNADPGILYGGREAMTACARFLCEGFGAERWIVNLGHGITPQVDPEDLRFFLEEVHRFASQEVTRAGVS